MRESGAAATGEGRGELDLRRVRERVLAKGFTIQQLESCIDEYADLDVSLSWKHAIIIAQHTDMKEQIWQTAAEGTRLVFIETGDDDADMDE